MKVEVTEAQPDGLNVKIVIEENCDNWTETYALCCAVANATRMSCAERIKVFGKLVMQEDAKLLKELSKV